MLEMSFGHCDSTVFTDNNTILSDLLFDKEEHPLQSITETKHVEELVYFTIDGDYFSFGHCSRKPSGNEKNILIKESMSSGYPNSPTTCLNINHLGVCSA